MLLYVNNESDNWRLFIKGIIRMEYKVKDFVVIFYLSNKMSIA